LLFSLIFPFEPYKNFTCFLFPLCGHKNNLQVPCLKIRPFDSFGLHRKADKGELKTILAESGA